MREHTWKRWTLPYFYNVTNTTVTSNPYLTFVRNWNTFVKVNEECLANITNSIDKYLPPLIQ